MKDNFNKDIHNKFIKKFNIKSDPSNIELEFYKKTEKYIKYIKWLPWLKMIWIWNSISMNCSSENSDIDLLIVSSNNSMWFNRILITLIFQILWVRKTTKKHAWRFCLSFFTTIDWLDFSSWKIENDLYLYFWILYFKPILNYYNTYEQLIEKNSYWADFNGYEDMIRHNKKYIKYLKPHPCPKGSPNGRNSSSPYQEKEATIFIFINKLLKNLFLPRTLKHYEKIWKPYWIIINDNILKFHDNDIRKQIKRELI